MPRPSERRNKYGFCPIYNSPKENTYVIKVPYYNRVEHTAGEIRTWGIKEMLANGKVELDDLPEDPCYRCGWFLLSTDWMYGLFGKKDPFYKACALHDDLYTPELRPEGLTRKQADQLFLSAMRTIIKEEHKGNICQAYVYYGIARSLGWLYW